MINPHDHAASAKSFERAERRRNELERTLHMTEAELLKDLRVQRHTRPGVEPKHPPALESLLLLVLLLFALIGFMATLNWLTALH